LIFTNTQYFIRQPSGTLVEAIIRRQQWDGHILPDGQLVENKRYCNGDLVQTLLLLRLECCKLCLNSLYLLADLLLLLQHSINLSLKLFNCLLELLSFGFTLGATSS